MNDDLFQRLRSAYCAKDDTIPPGFKTREQWQAEWKVGRTCASAMLKAGVAQGILSVIRLRTKSQVLPYYGAVEPPHKHSTPRRKAR